ncbi:hypothetical protein NL676_032306 [Syzygium grande]|nr:hypothetical protein NL676_032306 [Syzygium grande]
MGKSCYCLGPRPFTLRAYWAWIAPSNRRLPNDRVQWSTDWAQRALREEVEAQRPLKRYVEFSCNSAVVMMLSFPELRCDPLPLVRGVVMTSLTSRWPRPLTFSAVDFGNDPSSPIKLYSTTTTTTTNRPAPSPHVKIGRETRTRRASGPVLSQILRGPRVPISRFSFSLVGGTRN